MSFWTTVETNSSGSLHDRLAQVDRARDHRAVRESAARVDRGAADAFLVVAPGAHGIEILEREADRIHRRVTARARRVRAMRFELLPERHHALGVDLLEQRHVGRRRRRRRAEHVLEHPLAADDGRGAIGVRRHHQHAALAEQPQAPLVRRARLAGSAARTRPARRSASRRARSGTCSRPSSDRGRCDPRSTMLAKKSSVSVLQPLAQVVVEVRKARRSSARSRRGCAGTATGRRNCRRARRAFGSASMRATCASIHLRLRQLAGARQRRAARRPECCSTGRTTGATRARCRVSGYAEPGATDARVALDSEQELRARQQPLDRGLDAGLETVLLAAAVVEREQLAEIVLGVRAAIRTPCKRDRMSSAHARSALRRAPHRRVAGLTDEDPRARRGVAGARRVVGPRDGQRLDVRVARRVEDVLRASQERLQPRACRAARRCRRSRR